MPHEDGTAYAHVVATVSLGASICLDLTQKPTSADATFEVEQPADTVEITDESRRSATPQYSIPTRILQEPRSLLITNGRAYENLLHGISPIEVDENLNASTVANWSLLAEPHAFEDAGGRNERATRTSLTYRDVLKVSSAANKVLGGFGKR
jgi:alkylated DNA repair protein alkB family protein 6